jgi:hypothetical protein
MTPLFCVFNNTPMRLLKLPILALTFRWYSAHAGVYRRQFTARSLKIRVDSSFALRNWQERVW